MKAQLLIYRIIAATIIFAVNTKLYNLSVSGLFAQPTTGGIFGFIRVLFLAGIIIFVFAVFLWFNANRDTEKRKAEQNFFLFILIVEILCCGILVVLRFPNKLPFF